MKAEINENELVIWTPCWGTKHLDYLRNFAIPGAMQAGNIPACGYQKIFVEGSTIGDPSELQEILTKGFSGLPADVQVVEWFNERDATLTSLTLVVQMCLHRRSRMLLLMPDTIIANGGIFNMREYARGNGVSVAAPHLRVNADSLIASTSWKGWFKASGIQSGELVSYAMLHPHQSLSASFTHRDNGTFQGGIALKELSENLTTAIHFLPTVYLSAFTESDLRFFERASAFRAYDHEWPAHLANEGRLRIFGSSELFFAVELTDPDRNLVEIKPGSAFEEDSNQGPFWMRCFVGALHS